MTDEMMTDEEMFRELREVGWGNIADRIEALVKERDALIEARDRVRRLWINEKARAEAAEAALKEAVGLLTDAMVQLSEGKINTRRNRAFLIYSFITKHGSQT